MAALIQGQKLLAVLRQEIRQRIDKVILGAPLNTYPDPYANAAVTTPELNGYINGSCKEFADVLATDYGNYYTTASYAFLTDGVNEQFPLPLDHIKLLGAEWQRSPPGNNQNIALTRFMIGERDNYSFGYLAASASSPYPNTPAYAEFGTNLWLKPLPAGGMSIQLLYVPLPATLADQGTIVLNNVIQGDALVMNGITFFAQATTARTNLMTLAGPTFIGVPQTANPTVINYWSAATGTTAASLPAGLGSATPWAGGPVTDGSVSWNYFYPRLTAWSAGLTVTQTIIAIPVTGTPNQVNYWKAPSGTTGSSQPAALASPVPPATVTDGTAIWRPVTLPFPLGSTDSDTAAGIAFALNNSPFGGPAGFLTAYSNGITALFNLQGPAVITWSVVTANGNTNLNLSPNQLTGPTGWGANGAGPSGVGAPFIQWTNVFQEYSGWSEYVIVDCCIKWMVKEESFEAAQAFTAQKAFQFQRVQRAANLRDAANPHRITDVTSQRYFGYQRGRGRGRW